MMQPNFTHKRARNRMRVIVTERNVLLSERKRLEPYAEWNGPDLARIDAQLAKLDAEAKRVETRMREAVR